ncbi:MAG TPA: hypothetical protein VLJ18_06285 [Thermoanaerobaculia bacterium]|nr:hypothetical protein [Thermoanaerobaculia bacterium]
MKPEDRITAYLFAHKSSVEFSTVDLVVKDVKLSVFYGMTPISDDEIRKVVVRWASINAVGLLLRQPAAGSSVSTGPGTPATTADSDLVDAVKRAISTINDGVTIGKKGANVNIGVTGLTANLKKDDRSASLGISWGGTLKLDAESGPFHFSGNLAKDKWEITLSFPQDTYIPDLSSLGKVFTEGERALGKMADATRGFSNISDAGKIGALIKPHAAAVQDAVDAASGIAKASRQGGASFGFKVGSPEPGPGEEGIPGGVQGSVVFTYVF